MTKRYGPKPIGGKPKSFSAEVNDLIEEIKEGQFGDGAVDTIVEMPPIDIQEGIAAAYYMCQVCDAMTEQEAKQRIADKANEGLPVPVWTVEDFEVYEHEDGGWFCRDVLVSTDGVLSVEDILPLADESKWVGYSLLEDLVENGAKIPHDRVIREQAEEIERLREAVSVRDTRSTQTHILLDGKSSTTCRYCGMPPEKCMPDCPRATHPLEGKP